MSFSDGDMPKRHDVKHSVPIKPQIFL